MPSDFSSPMLAALMTDRLGASADDYRQRVLDPGCGTGNLLREILSRRLARSRSASEILRAVSSLYGVDISQRYILAARRELKSLIAGAPPLRGVAPDYRFWPLIDLFLAKNLLVADFLAPEKIIFHFWREDAPYVFSSEQRALASFLEKTS